MIELEPIRVSYLKELAITAVPIRIASKYLLNNKILQTNKDTIHYRTFIWLYKCFYFSKQRAIDGQDRRAVPCKEGKLQYYVPFEISPDNSTAGGNGPRPFYTELAEFVQCQPVKNVPFQPCHSISIKLMRRVSNHKPRVW